MAKAATPWGPAELLEELKVAQRAGEKRFSSVVQLLEVDGGEKLVRFAYTTNGSARRGPVTLRLRDLERPARRARGAAGARGGAGAQAAVRMRSRAASTSEPRITAPSAEPNSGSTACSGCGIRPKTVPVWFVTPAISATEPLGLSS